MSDQQPYVDASFGIDLREELDLLAPYGFSWFGLRQQDTTLPCPCGRLLDQGVSSSTFCQRCLNTGFLFTDFLVHGRVWRGNLGVIYPAKPGVLSTSTLKFIVRHDRAVAKGDLVLDLSKDEETGQPLQPFVVNTMYRISSVLQMDSDRGRLNHWATEIEEMTVSDLISDSTQGQNNGYVGFF